MKKHPNQASAGDCAVTSRLYFWRPGRAAPDRRRWTCCPMRCPLIALLALLMLNHIGFSADAQGPHEPFIEGRKLSVWLDQYQKSIPKPEYGGDPQMRARAEQAVRKLGTNSMPWLLVELN